MIPVYICNVCGAGSVSKVCIECGSSNTRPAIDKRPSQPVYVDKHEGEHVRKDERRIISWRKDHRREQ